MKKSSLLGLVVASVFSLTSLSAYAVAVSGQGTWETTLQARDFDGNPATIEGYYDRVLDITWLADTTAAGTTMNWDTANAWAAALDIYGITGWRLPFVVPYIDYSCYNGTAYCGHDIGYNNPTTSGSPPYPAVTVYSEMATMFYDTLGNLAQFDTSGNPQPGYGLTNTGPFDNLQSSGYWSGTFFSDVLARELYFSSGNQGVTHRNSGLNAWAVHDGDIGSPIPEPPPPALVGYWNFDEGGGETASDSSGNNNNGDVVGTKDWVPGRCGTALSFDAGADGSVDYVKVPYDPSIDTSEFTVSSWVSLADVTRNNVILDKRNDQWDRNFGLYYYVNESPPSEPPGNYLAILIGNGDSVNWYEYAAYYLHTPNQDQFFHIAATHHHSDGHSYLRLYLNAEMVAERELPEITGNVGDGDLYIGTHGYPQLDSSPTDGIIDEVRIYNDALTQAQIQADMEACFPETYAVPIDIKPESCPNPLNTKSQGVLPVAILGTADFDVTSIDAASIRLAGVAPVRSIVEDVATPVADPQNGCDCNELGGDGINDLTLKFDTQDIVGALEEVEDKEVVELTVTGVLTDGTPFEGKDCIVIRAKGGKGKVEEPDQCYAGVPKTGQTTSYSDYDDGYYQMGVMCPEPRFTDNEDGTVTDNCTGLVWLKDANCFGTKDWASALNDANGLASGSCGLTDSSIAGNWHLPNIRELRSLIDYAKYAPALPSGHPFTGVQTTWPNVFYWSSTTAPESDSTAWVVAWTNGYMDGGSKASVYYVWPVRGGN